VCPRIWHARSVPSRWHCTQSLSEKEIVGNFFKGWRRKIGISTLVIALTFMVGWVRSLSIIDVFNFPTGTYTAIAISTAGYSVNWRIGFDEDGERELDWYTMNIEMYEDIDPAESKQNHRYLYPIAHYVESVDWKCRGLGNGVGVLFDFIGGRFFGSFDEFPGSVALLFLGSDQMQVSAWRRVDAELCGDRQIFQNLHSPFPLQMLEELEFCRIPRAVQTQ
jgi:hypothetical protein